MTGVTLPIVTNGCQARSIIIRKVDDASLGEDGFRLRAEGDGLRIEGGVRGVLYGVYELLETHGGIGWFASYCTVVPKAEAFTVPADLDVTQKPDFAMREEYFYDMHEHGDFSARLRLNGSFNSLGERHGGIFGRVVQWPRCLGRCSTSSGSQDRRLVCRCCRSRTSSVNTTT